MGQSRNAMVAMCLVALMVAAASLPAATAYGCYDDCYERCANGKQDPACVKMCNEACGADAPTNAAGSTLDSADDKSLDATFQKADAAKAPVAGA
ncbi:unnamed protein product [Alopecurus aequalis]